jgi:hypothetical protein
MVVHRGNKWDLVTWKYTIRNAQVLPCNLTSSTRHPVLLVARRNRYTHVRLSVSGNNWCDTIENNCRTIWFNTFASYFGSKVIVSQVYTILTVWCTDGEIVRARIQADAISTSLTHMKEIQQFKREIHSLHVVQIWQLLPSLCWNPLFYSSPPNSEGTLYFEGPTRPHEAYEISKSRDF